MKKSLLSTCKTQDEEILLRQSFKAAIPFRDALEEVLESKMKEAHNAQISSQGYSTNAWPYKQADFCGYQRALKEIISFLS